MSLDDALCADGCGRLAETERPTADGRTEKVCGEHAGPVCPTCDRTMEQGCLPSSCPRWELAAAFDHESREWLPVDQDGFVLDGRRVEEVQ